MSQNQPFNFIVISAMGAIFIIGVANQRMILSFYRSQMLFSLLSIDQFKARHFAVLLTLSRRFIGTQIRTDSRRRPSSIQVLIKASEVTPLRRAILCVARKYFGSSFKRAARRSAGLFSTLALSGPATSIVSSKSSQAYSVVSCVSQKCASSSRLLKSGIGFKAFLLSAAEGRLLSFLSLGISFFFLV